ATNDFRLAYQRCPTHAIKRSDHPFNARPFSETGKA
ncbi:MAG: ferredoxin, partial [Lacticaseibacillus paracasei]|nr:ferredoxin [Lacticaseibacillus paracasei]